MRVPRTSVGLLLVALGLFGIAAYLFLTRPAHPALLSGDLSRGVWIGTCLGCEIMGIVILAKKGGAGAA